MSTLEIDVYYFMMYYVPLGGSQMFGEKEEYGGANAPTEEEMEKEWREITETDTPPGHA